MTCRDVADFLMDYLAGELPAATRDIFERHLRECPECREYLALYQTAVAMGRRAFAVENATAAVVDIPEKLVIAVVSSLQARNKAPKNKERTRRTIN